MESINQIMARKIATKFTYRLSKPPSDRFRNIYFKKICATDRLKVA